MLGAAPSPGRPRVPSQFAARSVSTYLLGFRVGLSLLFLVNALIAWIEPEQFTSILTASGAARIVDPELAIWMIRANDLVLGVLLLLAFNRWPRLIPAWAGLYLATVALTKAIAL